MFWKRASQNVDKCILKVIYRGEGGIDYKVIEEEVKGEFFSLSGLAYGQYSVDIEEYAGKELIVSSAISVSLKDKLDILRQEMKEGLDKVGRTVVATGRHTVVI